jgi:integrase
MAKADTVRVPTEAKRTTGERMAPVVQRSCIQRGHVYKTGKRGRQVWYGRYPEPVFEDGKWKRVQRNVRLGSLTELSTRNDALIALARFLQRLQPGTRAEAFYSAREFVEREWMARIFPTLKASTQSSYRTNLNRYVLPWLGEMRLREMRKGEVQAWLSALSESGLSRQTVKNIWSALSSLLRSAVDWGYIEVNPAHGVRLPARQPKAFVFLPAPDQVVEILKQLPEPSFTLMLVLVGAGLRVGEAIGLQREDIDLNRKNLTVRRDVWHGKVNSPKYAASERVVPLGPILAKHLEERIITGKDWLFEGGSSKPLDPRNLAKRQLHPVLDRLGIPRFSWHRLRKLHSTYLGDMSVSPRIMQAQLGHADAALTLNIYTQIIPESQRKAIENLEALLFRNVPREKEETPVQ